MFTIKKINDLIRCFNELEDFSITPDTQHKLVVWLKKAIQSKNKLTTENRKLRKLVKEMEENVDEVINEKIEKAIEEKEEDDAIQRRYRSDLDSGLMDYQS